MASLRLLSCKTVAQMRMVGRWNMLEQKTRRPQGMHKLKQASICLCTAVLECVCRFVCELGVFLRQAIGFEVALSVTLRLCLLLFCR